MHILYPLRCRKGATWIALPLTVARDSPKILQNHRKLYQLGILVEWAFCCVALVQRLHGWKVNFHNSISDQLHRWEFRESQLLDQHSFIRAFEESVTHYYTVVFVVPIRSEIVGLHVVQLCLVEIWHCSILVYLDGKLAVVLTKYNQREKW